MWSKLSGALSGSRRGAPAQDELARHSVDDETGVFSAVLNAHPNLSVFHDDVKELPTVPEALSPPPSPGKKRGMLKRLSKLPPAAAAVDGAQPSPGPGLKFTLSRKGKSSISLSGNPSQASLQTRETGSLRGSSVRISTDTTRPSVDSVRTPGTPLEGRFGSIRSILKDKNTPATGQSVRFFSRDAYKTISPDISAASASEHEDVNFMERLQGAQLSPDGDKLSLPRVQARKPLARDLFAPPGGSSTPPMSPSDSMKLAGGAMALPAPEISNIFDLASGDLPAIPTRGAPLLDDAVEVFEGDSSRDSGFSVASSEHSKLSGMSHASSANSAPSRMQHEGQSPTVFHSPPSHDRSHSFSFGSSVFRAPEPADNGRLADAYPGRPPSRNRSMSDTVFQSMFRSSTPRPEADIRDTSSNSLVLEPPRSAKPPPDPFSANATTYYTPGTVLPPSPPQLTHRRTASVEENVLWQLRTQLAVQTEMAAQYEIDLRARDALVSALTAGKEALERDEAKRTRVIRALRRKCGDLEALVGGLQDAVDSSREESFERSMMDAASDAALREIQGKLGAVQRENAALRATAEKAAKEAEAAREKLAARAARERELADGIAAAQEQIEALTAAAEGDTTGRFSLHSARSRNSSAPPGDWADERARLVADAGALTNQLDRTRETLLKREDELKELKAELEAQWKHTEVSGETIAGLKREKDELLARVGELEQSVQGRASDEQLSALQAQVAELQQRLETAHADASSAGAADDATLAALRAELEAQQRHAEVSDDEIVRLKAERDALQTQAADLEAHIDELEAARAAAEGELAEADALRDQLEADKAELEQHIRDEQAQVDDLTAELQARQDRVDTLEQELKFAKDSADMAERKLSDRNNDVGELAQRIVASEDRAEELQEKLTIAKRDADRAREDARRAALELSTAQTGTRTQIEEAVRDKAAAEVEAEALRQRVEKFEGEIEKLRKTVHVMRQESASKDLELQKAQKERDDAKDDVFNMNVALDSKQQELEMVKRKQSAHASAASVSAPTAAPRPSLVSHRRDSSISTTAPAPASRPSSRLSETSSGAESELRKSVVRPSSSMATPKTITANRRLSTLTKSTSANLNPNLSTPTPAAARKPRGIDGAMGPPPAAVKPRASVATPTPASGHSRVPSLSSRPGVAGSAAPRNSLSSSVSTPTMARRTSSSGSTASKLSGLRSPPPGPVRETEEKENVQDTLDAQEAAMLV